MILQLVVYGAIGAVWVVFLMWVRSRLRSEKFCEQCGMYGHRKWLWLGTHRTHRFYLRYKMWRVLRKYREL